MQTRGSENVRNTPTRTFFSMPLTRSFRKIYPLKPRTCKEFLALSKSYTKASLMLDTSGQTDMTSESEKHKERLPNVTIVYPEQESDLTKSMRELIQETCEKKEE